jgi:hypothetical protein
MKQHRFVAFILILILTTTIYTTVAIEPAEGMKKGSHHSSYSKSKISESMSKYHETGKTKKQRSR